jgi:integrase
LKITVCVIGAGAGGTLATKKEGSMEKKRASPWERVKNVQHLWRRRYETANGERREKFYARFTCKLKHKARCEPLGSDLAAAKESITRILGDNVAGKDFDQEQQVQGMTLFPWVERFEQVKASKRSLSKDKESAAKLKAHFGNCALESITTSAIEAYKQKRLTEKTKRGSAPKPATINREVAFLRSLLVLAARDRLIEHIPYVELFEENNQRDRIASNAEFQAILEHSDEHLKEILGCLWDTGMRKREVLKLTWDRVDLKNDLITLGALAKDGQVDTKTKQARLIPLSPRLKAALLAIWQREKGGKVSRITDRVFLFRGKPIERFDRSYKTACEKAGVNGLWIHDIRATFATRKIAEGFDRDWVKMITGHKTDNVFKRYNRPSLESLRRVVQRDENLQRIWNKESGQEPPSAVSY